MDWVPCPDCWSECEYHSEQYIILDSYGSIAKNDDGSPVLASEWPPTIMPGQGHTVDVERNTGGEIIKRTFRGCPACGGSGECVKRHPEDDYIGTGISWYQWVIVEGGVVDGTGKVTNGKT